MIEMINQGDWLRWMIENWAVESTWWKGPSLSVPCHYMATRLVSSNLIILLQLLVAYVNIERFIKSQIRDFIHNDGILASVSEHWLLVAAMTVMILPICFCTVSAEDRYLWQWSSNLHLLIIIAKIFWYVYQPEPRGYFHQYFTPSRNHFHQYLTPSRNHFHQYLTPSRNHFHQYLTPSRNHFQ
jgi:hypothetical protein